MALAHPAGQIAQSTAVFEVRGLNDLTDRLSEHPDGFVLVEVTPNDFEAVLTWVATATMRDARMAAVGLLDFPSRHSDDAETALREAGAIDVIRSPRQMRPLLAVAERHASRCNMLTSRHGQAHQSFESWAWSQLPWQDAARPLG
jgi:hypothetical protein